MKITPIELKALVIIETSPGIRPREFARKMWPQSPGWSRVAKCGNGSHRGGGMYGAGGGYLGKMRRKGLITYSNSLTEIGKKELVEARTREPSFL